MNSFDDINLYFKAKKDQYMVEIRKKKNDEFIQQKRKKLTDPSSTRSNDPVFQQTHLDVFTSFIE